MASPSPPPSLRQLQLATLSETPSSSPLTSISSPQSNSTRLKQQRRQSSISYTSSSPNSNGIRSLETGAPNRRSSVDYSRSLCVSPTPTHKRRPRPLSIAIPNHDPSFSSILPAPPQPRPQTLTEIYAPFLSLIANKEAQVSELRSQLTAQEKELAILKRKWEKIVRNHLAFPDRENDCLTGVDGLDKIIRGIQSAAKTAADAASEASSDYPSPMFSRFSLESSAPSASADTNHTSADTSFELPMSPKPLHTSPCMEPTTIAIATSTARRRLSVPAEMQGTMHAPSGASSAPVSSTSAPLSSTLSNPKIPRQRNNGMAPLPGTALGSAAFSLIPNGLMNVNFSDLKGGMDKFISPQQQKRASKVFEGLWEAVASPSAVTAAAARKEKRKEKLDRLPVNLLEADEEEETIIPSKSSQFTVMAPDNSLKVSKKKELDLSITASPSFYLTAERGHGFHIPRIKEEEKESEDSSEDWNW